LQSEYWNHYVSSLGHTAPTLIVNNFVPDALVERRASPVPAVPRFLLCCGETPRLKGAYVLLDAVGDLVERGVQAEVVLLSAPGTLREEIRNAGLERNVKALGSLPHCEALGVLRRTDVFLQISISEGFPNMLLEAMALGCACIVTPVGAVPEVVGTDGECAFVIPAGDADLLADRMTRLAGDRDLVARMAAAAQARIAARYTERTVARVLDRAYQSVMQGAPNPSRAEEYGASPFDR
jgi:glycosyltransferase involved in cell wall biosynthesis